jgi:hypothetical protein
MIIDILREEFESWQQTLPASAIAKFEELPRPGNAGRAVRVTIDMLPWAAEATVWESGDADLISGNLATGDVEPYEHMELTSRLGVRVLLEDMARAVGN